MSLKAALTAAGCAAALALSAVAQAQTAAGAPAANASANAGASVSASKQALVARVLQLQQSSIEGMARGMVEQPAMQIIQQANGAMQRVPADRRDAVARDIEADVRKYVDETAPQISSRAVSLAPSTIGVLLQDRFTEDELRQVIALLESPVNRKFQQLAPEMQRAISEKLVSETRGQVAANARAMEQSVSQRLASAVGAASAPAPAPAKANRGPGPSASAARK